MLHVALLHSPLVAPAARSYDTGKLGTELIIILQAELRTGPYLPTEIGRQEREKETRKVDGRFGTQFGIVFVTITALQTGHSFVCPTQLDHKQFRALKQVAMLERDGSGCTQVARRIGSFQLERNRLMLALGQHHISVQQSTVVPLDLEEADIRIFQCLQTPEVGISALNVVLIVQAARSKLQTVGQHPRPQIEIVFIVNGIAFVVHGVVYLNAAQG